MYLSLSKNDLQQLIRQLTGVAPDELELLNAATPFCDDITTVKNAKILFLVGCGRLYPVNGVTFDNKQDVVATINPGAALTFVKEPDNPHDKYAIKVLFETHHIGYIPRKLALLINDCVEELFGEVQHVVGNTNNNENLGLRFVFRRISSLGRKQLVNMDMVAYLLDDIRATPADAIATAQMLSIINNEYQPEEIQEEQEWQAHIASQKTEPANSATIDTQDTADSATIDTQDIDPVPPIITDTVIQDKDVKNDQNHPEEEDIF